MHGAISRKEAEALVKQVNRPNGGKDGTFLFRRKQSAKAGGFVLSMFAKGRCEHHHIAFTDDGGCTMNRTAINVRASTLGELAQHLSANKEQLTCVLKTGVPTNTPVTALKVFSSPHCLYLPLSLASASLSEPKFRCVPCMALANTSHKSRHCIG